jgi:hypothetical protein
MPALKTDGARLLYTWLLPHVDVNGCFSGDPETIKGLVFTKLRKSVKTIAAYLKNLAEIGLIILYNVDGEAYLHIPDFKDKQPSLNPDREAKTTIPLPTPDQFKTNSGLTPLKVKESKVKESKDKICVIFSHWNSKKQKGWKSHRELTPEISEAIEERLKKYSPEQLVEAIDNYARVLLSPEFVWSRDWPLRLFLTRSRPDQRGELQLYRFLGTNFSEQDFELTSLGKQRREERKKYSDKIIAASEESLLKIYRDKNYTRQWLIDELRPEILEIINKE